MSAKFFFVGHHGNPKVWPTKRTYGRTDRVGARDTCLSKKHYIHKIISHYASNIQGEPLTPIIIFEVLSAPSNSVFEPEGYIATEYAQKATERNCPSKVDVFKNKVKCLPTVTVLLLASISPENKAISVSMPGGAGGYYSAPRQEALALA